MVLYIKLRAEVSDLWSAAPKDGVAYVQDRHGTPTGLQRDHNTTNRLSSCAQFLPSGKSLPAGLEPLTTVGSIVLQSLSPEVTGDDTISITV